jgi:hypothetical protein
MINELNICIFFQKHNCTAVYLIELLARSLMQCWQIIGSHLDKFLESVSLGNIRRYPKGISCKERPNTTVSCRFRIDYGSHFSKALLSGYREGEDVIMS